MSLAAMRYDDEYQREDAQWQFKKRVISFLYYMPVTEYASAWNDPHRLTIKGVRMPADYPESLPSWQQFAARYVKAVD